MKLIKPHFEIIEQQPGILGLYKQIELSGRVAYKSEDKITEDSYKGFVDRIIKLNHGAVLEHGTVYLAIPRTTYAPEAVNIYDNNSYSKVNECNEFIFTDKYGDKVAAWCVTTNLRVLVENDCLEDLEFLCEPTEYHERRICVKFICDRGISHEFVRHRTFSFLMESTRYCNYSKNKFGNELTFIQPCYLNEAELAQYGPYHLVIRNKSPESIFICSLNNAEKDYLTLIESGWKPQEARAVLPNALKTELVMTGFASDWKHFFWLRSNKYGKGGAHPSASELADSLYEEFVSRDYIANIK